MIVTIIAWISFYFLHSCLIDDRFKDVIFRRFPGIRSSYRLIYNTISLLTFGLAWLVQRVYSEHLSLFEHNILQFAGVFLFMAGIIVIYLAFRKYDTREFIGLRASNDQELITTGLNSWVRHPIYFATLLVILGYFLYRPDQGSLIFCTVSTIYVFVGARLEERKLIKHFGYAYINYRKRVRMIIPFII